MATLIKMIKRMISNRKTKKEEQLCETMEANFASIPSLSFPVVELLALHLVSHPGSSKSWRGFDYLA